VHHLAEISIDRLVNDTSLWFPLGKSDQIRQHKAELLRPDTFNASYLDAGAIFSLNRITGSGMFC